MGKVLVCCLGRCFNGIYRIDGALETVGLRTFWSAETGDRASITMCEKWREPGRCDCSER